MDEHGYWWCLKHNRVEGYEGCANTKRLGPFRTEAEAARALRIVHERNERYDKEDRAWQEGEQ